MRKTKRQLIDELEHLRARVADLQNLEAKGKQETARLRWIEEAAELSSEGMAVVDLEGNLIFLNKAFAGMHGYDPEELIGKNLSIFHNPDQMPTVDAANRELREKGTFSGEIWHARRDGSVFPTWMQNTVLRDREGRPTCMIGTVRDISGLKRSEEALRDSEQRFRAVFDQTYQFTGLLAPEGTLLKANPTALGHLGLEESDVLGKPFWEAPWWTHSPELRERLRDAVNRAGTGEFVRFEVHHPNRDGVLHYLDFSLRPVIDPTGKVVLLVPEGRDISDRKSAEANLRESEKNYRNLVDNALVGIFRRDLDGAVYYVNRAFLSMLEYDSVEEMRCVPFREAYEDPRAREEIIEAFKTTGKVVGREIRLLTKSGKTKSVLMNGVLENGIMSGMTMDITERKVMEEELRQNEERHRALFEGSLDAILLVDPESGRVVDSNPAASDLFLRRKDEIIGLDHVDLYPLRFRPTAAGEFARIVNERDQDQPIETIVLCRDRTERPVEVMAHIIQIDGRLVVYQEFRDISDRKRTADALHRTLERYRTLFDDSPIPLMEEDLSEVKTYLERIRHEGVSDFREYFESHPAEVERCADMVKLVDVNEATLELTEAKSKEDFVQRRNQLVTAQTYEGFREVLIAVAEGKTYIEIETVGQTFAGKRKDVQLRWSVPKAYEQTLERLLVSIVDLTDRKRMEQELGNVQRLQSLGVLAGGIAHDFNNILTVILTNLSMGRLYGELDEEVSRMLADAEKASLRARALTQQLLTFARGGEPIKRVVRVCEIVRESASFAVSGSKARCECWIPEDLWLVDADEGQLSQVFQNLVMNADQAMPEGGVIRICAQNVRIGENERGKLERGRAVKVSVIDQGCGMPEERIRKIFDPFFTTKERGRGLGLAIAFSIVNRHGGYIEVDSEPGRGSAFHVYLPTTKRSAPPEEEEQAFPDSGGARVLVVDDEELVRKSAASILSRLGYEAEIVKDGRKGIEAYERAMKEDRPFHVVILDLTIPGGFGGEKVVRALRRLDPAAKVIVSSGYSDDPVLSQFSLYGFDGVLPKPYKVADLAAVIRKVLVG